MSTSHLSLQPDAEPGLPPAASSPSRNALQVPAPTRTPTKTDRTSFCKSSMKFGACAKAVYTTRQSSPSLFSSKALSSFLSQSLWYPSHPHAWRRSHCPTPTPQPACWFLRQQCCQGELQHLQASGRARAAVSTGQAAPWRCRFPGHLWSVAAGTYEEPCHVCPRSVHSSPGFDRSSDRLSLQPPWQP